MSIKSNVDSMSTEYQLTKNKTITDVIHFILFSTLFFGCYDFVTVIIVADHSNGMAHLFYSIANKRVRGVREK